MTGLTLKVFMCKIRTTFSDTQAAFDGVLESLHLHFVSVLVLSLGSAAPLRAATETASPGGGAAADGRAAS